MRQELFRGRLPLTQRSRHRTNLVLCLVITSRKPNYLYYTQLQSFRPRLKVRQYLSSKLPLPSTSNPQIAAALGTSTSPIQHPSACGNRLPFVLWEACVLTAIRCTTSIRSMRTTQLLLLPVAQLMSLATLRKPGCQAGKGASYLSEPSNPPCHTLFPLSSKSK